jgi:DNA-binding LytR/AlgR family response regulator
MESILFIEDDKALRENLEKILILNNYTPLMAENGRTGLELAKTKLPDLIICDIMLPDLDGYKILEELSAEKETGVIPFIFLTAKAEMNDLRKGMNMGADDYLLKPLKIKELLDAIRLRLDKKRKVFELATPHNKNGDENLNEDDTILVSMNSKVKSIIIKDIVCIISAGVYTYLHFSDGKKILIRKIIKEWESLLPEKSFIRIHRNSIININYVISLEKCKNNTYNVYLKNYDQPLHTSHRCSSKIRQKVIH